MSNETVSTLQAIRDRIAKPKGWIQGSYLHHGAACMVGAANVTSFKVKNTDNGFVDASHPGYNSPERIKVITYLAAACYQIETGGKSHIKPPKNTAEVAELEAKIIGFNDSGSSDLMFAGEYKTAKVAVLAACDRAISNAKRRHLNGG